MTNRGRPAKPTPLKVLDGTYREDRHGPVDAEPTTRILESVPVAPDGLSARGIHHWNEAGGLLLEMGILTTAELPSLLHYARTQQEIYECEDDIAANGWVQVNAKSGMEYDRPVVKRRAGALDRLMRLFGRFGFTPSDRVGMKVEAPKPKSSVGVGSRKRG